VTLVEPTEFFDGNGIEYLNRSIGVVTHSTDFNKLMTLITAAQKENSEKYADLVQKTIFLVSSEDFVRLNAVCSGETT
jgi:hypothetical protein